MVKHGLLQLLCNVRLYKTTIDKISSDWHNMGLVEKLDVKCKDSLFTFWKMLF